MKLKNVDNNRDFDFGKTSANYAKYRDIYPIEFYDKLYQIGVGQKDQSWLDLGTGTGVIPRAMYHYGAKIAATDISENQIKEAIRMSHKKDMNIEYKTCPAEDTGYADSSFDVITACQCIMYFDMDIFIPEVIRLLKPKGLFVKTYMSFTKDDPIASKTKELILKFNPDWSASAPAVNSFFMDYFENPIKDSFYKQLPFTRESWLGRTKTMRGVQAQMSEDVFEKFCTAHEKMLADIAPDEFTIEHRVFITAYRISKL